MLQHGPVSKEAITFRLLPVWMPALHPQDHSLAQPLSVRRKQWFSAPRKQLPRVVYQLPTEAVTTVLQWVKAQPQLARTGSITNVARLHTAQLLVKPGMQETTRWRRCQSHGHLTENCIQEVEPARELLETVKLEGQRATQTLETEASIITWSYRIGFILQDFGFWSNLSYVSIPPFWDGNVHS